MRFLLPLVAAVAVLLPAQAAAKPPLCTKPVITQKLIDLGKLGPDDGELGVVVDLVRCGDVTNDGTTDAIFTIASGGTAGDTRFGVLRGNADGSSDLVLFRQGYKLGIARHNRRSFDVIQPHYKANEPNCCPSSFRIRRYAWAGDHFKKVGKTKKRKHAPRRFYRP